MEILSNISFYFFSFVIVVSIIVFVHEFGHYYVAILNKVKVDVSQPSAVCFSKDGAYYSAIGDLISNSKVLEWIYICGDKVDSCNPKEFVIGVPNMKNLYILTWSRFGNITLEKWDKNNGIFVAQ